MLAELPHSWKNPLERLIYTYPKGCDALDFARAKMPEEFEVEVAKCNTLADS